MNAELTSRTAAGEWVRLLKRTTESANEAAFALLVERQSRFVFKVVYAVLRNVEDAEDVTQETFLKVFRSRAWTEIKDERRFLARAAWRLAVSRRPSRQSGSEIEPGEVASVEQSPEKAALLTEETTRVHRLIDALPEKLRRPLALACLHELTTDEVAAIMKLPLGTVRRRLSEARTLLKEKLRRLEGEHNHV